MSSLPVRSHFAQIYMEAFEVDEYIPELGNRTWRSLIVDTGLGTHRCLVWWVMQGLATARGSWRSGVKTHGPADQKDLHPHHPPYSPVQYNVLEHRLLL